MDDTQHMYHSHDTMMTVPKFHKVHSALLHHQHQAASTEGHPMGMEQLQEGETEQTKKLSHKDIDLTY